MHLSNFLLDSAPTILKAHEVTEKSVYLFFNGNICGSVLITDCNKCLVVTTWCWTHFLPMLYFSVFPPENHILKVLDICRCFPSTVTITKRFYWTFLALVLTHLVVNTAYVCWVPYDLKRGAKDLIRWGFSFRFLIWIWQ